MADIRNRWQSCGGHQCNCWSDLEMCAELMNYNSGMFSSKSMTPIDRELSKRVVKIIHGLLMMEESAPFRKPVPHKALGLEDYKAIVKKPTDLNLIRRQNNEGKYKFVEEILDEIQLCWDNCKLYNAVDSEIYEQALHLEKAFDKFGIEILPENWKDVSREEYNARFNERKLEDQKLKKPERGKKEKQPQPVLEYPSEELSRSRPKKPISSKMVEQMEEEVAQRVEEQEREMQEQAAYSQPNLEKESMQAEAGEEGVEATVEPIMINLNECPSREELLELSSLVNALYTNGDMALLQKVVEVLHTNEKENMALNKNGLMTFRMNHIHNSTFHRIKRLLAPENEPFPLIE